MTQKIQIKEIKVLTVRCPKSNGKKAVRTSICVHCPYFRGFISGLSYIECASNGSGIVRRMAEEKDGG